MLAVMCSSCTGLAGRSVFTVIAGHGLSHATDRTPFPPRFQPISVLGFTSRKEDRAMATFYVLPPRECMEQVTSDFLARIIPGISVKPTLFEDLLEIICADGTDCFFLHREDLSGEGALLTDLIEGFGAEAGDHVIEVGLATGSAPARVKSWLIPSHVSESLLGG